MLNYFYKWVYYFYFFLNYSLYTKLFVLVCLFSGCYIICKKRSLFLLFRTQILTLILEEYTPARGRYEGCQNKIFANYSDIYWPPPGVWYDRFMNIFIQFLNMFKPNNASIKFRGSTFTLPFLINSNASRGCD